MDAEWDWSDAWVLAAIMLGRPEDGPTSLRNVVAAGDYVNHAIFTEGEVEQAVRRLLAIGLITTSAAGFALTPAGQALVPNGRVAVLTQVDRLLTALRRHPVQEVEWHLEPGALRAAADAWHRDATGT